MLVVNLGTPDAPDKKSLKKYLREFLTDPRVLDVPWLIRRMIVHFFILPKRPEASAQKYARIWRENGSPLRIYTDHIRDALQKKIPGYTVKTGMRYGSPSLSTVAKQFAEEGIRNVVILPLYPHYAMSSYETAVVAAEKALEKQEIKNITVSPYYSHPNYIETLTRTLEKYLNKPYDYVVFSYHGIPVRHLEKTDPTHTHCRADDSCCTTSSSAHATCYRHQVFETTRLVAERAKIPREKIVTSFQSRVGRAKWLTPSTEETLRGLPERGGKKILVIAPSFVTDGLETLEELDIVGRKTFLDAGGEDFTYIPALNESPDFIGVLAGFVEGA